MRVSNTLVALVLAMGLGAGCTEDVTAPEDLILDDTYSGSVQRIFSASCVATDCHGTVNPGSGLVLTSWETLIAGSRFGESIIPFAPEHSHLIDHLTGRAEPRMPLSRDPLPADQIEIVRAWIANGARSDAGAVPYDGARERFYVTNQASDQVSVIDAEANVVIRVIDVGDLPNIESPHNVHVDRDSNYWYVTLINSAQLLQYDARTDELRQSVTVGNSPANPITSPDGSMVYVTNWSPTQPTLHALDTATLTEQFVITFLPNVGESPHGLAIAEDGSTLFTTHEVGNSVFKIVLGDNPPATLELSFVSLYEAGESTATPLMPLQIVLDQDERFGYVTCNGSGDVRVVDLDTMQLVKAIEIGGRPWLAALTPDGSRIYVANWGSNSVDVLDTQTQARMAVLDNTGLDDPVFARPHGVSITPDGRYVYVSNENTNGAFPPHHPTEGGGNNGNVAVIEIATNTVVKVLEVEVDPTGVAFAGTGSVALPGAARAAN